MSVLEALLSGLLAGDLIAGPEMSTKEPRLEDTRVPLYRFDNGLTWYRITSLDDLKRLWGIAKLGAMEEVPYKASRNLVRFDLGPVFALIDDTTEMMVWVISFDRDRIDFMSTRSLYSVPIKADGKADMPAFWSAINLYRSAVITFLFDWMNLSPDLLNLGPIKQLSLPYIVEDVHGFMLLQDTEGHRSKRYQDEVVNVLNRGLEDLEQYPYYSGRDLRNEMARSKDRRVWWTGDRVDVEINAMDSRMSEAWHVQMRTSVARSNSLPDALIKTGKVKDIEWWNEFVDENVLPGRPEIDLEPYYLLDTLPPPLMKLSDFKKWAAV